MKLGEVVVHIEYYNFTKFHHILMKKIIVLYQTHLTDGPFIRGRRLGWTKLIHSSALVKCKLYYLRCFTENKSSKTWREIWDFFFDNPGSIFVQWMGLDICLTDTITNYYTCGGNSMYYVYRRITFQTFFGFSPRRMHSLVFYRYVNKSCFLIYDLIILFDSYFLHFNSSFPHQIFLFWKQLSTIIQILVIK